MDVCVLCVLYTKDKRQKARTTRIKKKGQSTKREQKKVGIATLYGLDGPGIESVWGRGFLHPFRPCLRPAQPSLQWAISGANRP
jgi:hypothetical protein